MTTSARPSLVLLLILGIALAAGAAASLLIGAATAPGAPASPSTSVVYFPDWLLAYTFLAAIVAIAGFLVIRRVSGGAAPVPGRIAITLLVTILLAVMFLAATRVLVTGGPGPSGKVSPVGANNSTTTGGGTTNKTANASCTPAVCAGGLLWSPHLPGWFPYVILVAVVLVAVAVAIPQVRLFLSDRDERRALRSSRGGAATAVQSALERADQDLAGGTDPRAVILALYQSVLEHLQPKVASVEIETPEEIRAKHLIRLGIRPVAAESLTRLFEEARYSSHLMSADAAANVRRAVQEALEDLARSSSS
jgi:hypothetical protein